MIRDYQIKWIADVYEAWNRGAVDVMATAPTGAGKSFMIGTIVRELNQPTCAIAHRMELVSQLALAMNREKVYHSIIAPTEIIRQTMALEMDTHGETYYRANAPLRVASVQTLAARDIDKRWANMVANVIIDEGHHVLADNTWGDARRIFPRARGLLPTAHALRADGKGLGRSADGIVDALVLGPPARELINRGFLTDYRLFAPKSDIDISQVPIGSTGDFSERKLSEAVHKSKTIVGDIVSHYLQHAAGLLGITFVVDVQAAAETAAAYRARGVAAEVITAKTPIPIRGQLMRKFRNRELLQLVNVGVLGEGVDVPAVEVVSMAAHTMSFQKYAQQFGRALRTNTGFESEWDAWTDAQRLAGIASSSKPRAIVIDHVDNWLRLGLPDRPRTYTLDRRERRARGATAEDAIPLRACPFCEQVYERVVSVCPFCGTPAPVGRRSLPEFVDGNLYEVDPEWLRECRGEIARIAGPAHTPLNAPQSVAFAITKKHAERQRAQLTLRDTIALWAGWQRHQGREDSETYRRFFFAFRTDIASAQTLGARDASELETAIRADLDKNGVISL